MTGSVFLGAFVEAGAGEAPPLTPLPEIAALQFLSVLTIITVLVFGVVLRRIARTGGRVRSNIFALPELLISLVLGGFFLLLIVQGITRDSSLPAPEITLDQVLPNALIFVVMAAGVAGFLRFRGIKLTEALGLRAQSGLQVFGIAFGLLLAIFPLILCGTMAMQLLLKQSVQEQELVTLFKDVARSANRAGIVQIFFAGAVLAPLCEEFLFRGLFYPVFKRYLGPVFSALFTSALFSAFHLNLAAFPSLFLLALGFTIAFEATGSLLVPITMHALFNATQLGFLYLLSTQPPPA